VDVDVHLAGVTEGAAKRVRGADSCIYMFVCVLHTFIQLNMYKYSKTYGYTHIYIL
jgi:hypothetical protein